MDSVNGASWAVAVAMGLMGLAGGLFWGRLRSSAARQKRAGKLTALRAELAQHQLRTGALEADLHAQRARNFALERDLEARESDWAQSSPTPFSFDAQTFQIDLSARADLHPWPQNASQDASLVLQVRELEDTRPTPPQRVRPPRSRSAHPSRKAPERRQVVAPAWVELVAANSAHGTLQPLMGQDGQPQPQRRADRRRQTDSLTPGRESSGATDTAHVVTAGEIEGLARRTEAVRSTPLLAKTGKPAEPEPIDLAGRPDDLKLIAGIDASVEVVLNAAGYRSFRDIAAAKPEELTWALAAASPRLSNVLTDAWQRQAALLADRRTSAFRKMPNDHDDATRTA